jgi:hypothetical protein
MAHENLVSSIESEWEPEDGFFWSIRGGHFRKAEFDRALKKFAALPAESGDPLPARLVSLVWYAPLFMHWQIDRVRELGGDPAEYENAMNQISAEVERVLGVP